MLNLTPARFKYAVLLCCMTLVFAFQVARPAAVEQAEVRAGLLTLRGAAGSESAKLRPRYDRAVRIRLRVERVRREGHYEAALRGVAREWRVLPRYRSKQARRGPARFRMSYDRATLGVLASPAIRVLLKINRYDLVAGCELDARLYGRAGLQDLPEGAYGRYLAGRGMVARLQLSRRYHLIGVDCSRATAGGRLHAALRTILQKRAGLDYRDARYGIVLGLLLGNQGFLQRDVKERARRLGVAHLFAASGLHLGIFYACLYWPLGRIFGRRDPRALFLPLAPCLLYLLALDAPVSLLRAFCFLSSHALGSLCHRHVPVRELLVNTALLILVLAPAEFFRIGTALSFGAVGGILYFARALGKSLFAGSRFRSLRAHASVSLAAGICTVPLIVLFFEQHPALSLPANLLLVPLVGVLLPCIAAVCVLSFAATQIDFALPAVGFALSGASAAGVGEWLWLPVNGGLELFVILSEILIYVDECFTPRIVRDTGGVLLFGMRALPLFADLLLVGGVLGLQRSDSKRRRRPRAGASVAPEALQMVRDNAQIFRRGAPVFRFMIQAGLVFLGPPGVWLEALVLYGAS